MRTILAVLLALAAPLALPQPACAQGPVVRALLFYAPTCPHCHDIINEHLPPLRERYGDALTVVGIDVTTEGGQMLYQATIEHFALPESRLGVPTMLVGSEIMVGSLEIPQRFPGLIETGLAAGGIDWPPVVAIRQALASQGILVEEAPTPENPTASGGAAAGGTDTTAPRRPAPAAADSPAVPGQATTGEPASQPDRAPAQGTPADANPEAADTSPAPDATGPPPVISEDFSVDSADTPGALGPRGRFMQDPTGNGVAVGALVLLLGVLAWSLRAGPRYATSPSWGPTWLFPLLALVGVGIASYLSFVEVTGTQAVCGPVGDCNTVQQSPYARIFGVLPVGVLGVAGYIAMMTAWVVAVGGSAAMRGRAWAVAWILAVMGVSFSAYLTFLEPFVIGATCAWCVSSALVMAGMLALTTRRRPTSSR